MFGETYSLRLITEFLTENGIEFKYSNSRVGMGLYSHGCSVQINDTYKLSIQTHTDVVGPSFVEVALQDIKAKKIVNDGTYGYFDVIRFDTPKKLFDHLLAVIAHKDDADGYTQDGYTQDGCDT